MVHDQHEWLRRAAVRWLSSHKHCSVVLSEIVSCAQEIPDAIGWKYDASTLIECKSSKSDFCKNFDKPTATIGTYRYFLSTPDVISEQYFDRKIAEQEGQHSDWGLLWPKYPLARCPNLQVIRQADQRTPDYQQENRLLISALRRVQTRSFITILAPEERVGTED